MKTGTKVIIATGIAGVIAAFFYFVSRPKQPTPNNVPPILGGDRVVGMGTGVYNAPPTGITKGTNIARA